MTFPNFAGKSCDAECIAELETAGIKVEKMPEFVRDSWNGEVKTIIFGSLHGWTFKRAWYYWVAEGPGLPLEYAIPLHQAHGKEVRVDGHCSYVSPFWCGGASVNLYHVDSQIGLLALADAIDKAVKDARERYAIEYAQHIKEYESK